MSQTFDASFWDARYRSRERVWSGEPNPLLVEVALKFAPGVALDVGCGEGADAIWLAEHGWRVTATDISLVALERARAISLNDDVAGRIEWMQTDYLSSTPPEAHFDFVTAHFMHLPKALRDELFRRIAACVKPGGTLLIVGHHPSDLETTIPRPPLPELFYTAEEVAALLDASLWEILTSATRARSAVDPNGQTVAIADTMFEARRRA